jgi:prepilin-type N-terminal cleavage/methylation domain-containing protein
MSKTIQKQAAFTLVEILIVIAILAILAVVTFVVINPAQRINDANDARIREDVNAIANAISLYVVDNTGQEPVQDATAAAESALCTNSAALPDNSGAGLSQANLVAGTGTAGQVGVPIICISDALLPDFIASLPVHPTGGNYYIGVDANGSLMVGGVLTTSVPFIVTQ